MKHRIKKDDLVSWKSGRKTLYARVLSVKEGVAKVALRIDPHWGDELSVPVEKLKYEPPVILTVEALRRFSRFEISYSALVEGRNHADKEIPQTYQIVPDDLKEAVLNYHKRGVSEDYFAIEYFWPLWDEVYFGVEIENALNGPCRETGEMLMEPNQYTVFSTAWDILLRKFEYNEEDVELDEIVSEVQIWEDNKNKPLLEREFSTAQKKDFIGYWDNNRLASADETIKATYRRVLDSMCEAKDTHALKTKAYACYGHGNAAYGQDWDTSMKCLLQLMELDPNPITANTLGYMYYYGRCNNGVPEYDKAFYYFSIGAAGGIYESRYKLADMFQHGYGVAKNPEATAAIIWELYTDQLKKIGEGEFSSNFADVALRAGNLYKEGIDCWPDPDKAYYHYLQAQYAIQMRILAEDNYGDKKVAAGIEEAIAEVLPLTNYAKKTNTVHYYNLFLLLQQGLRKKHYMEMRIHRISETEMKLTFRIVPYETEKYNPKLFVTVPEAHFCGLMEKVTVKVKDITDFTVYEDTDTVLFDSISGDTFYKYGKKVAIIKAEYVFVAPVNRGKEYSFVSVEFTPGGKRYDYLCDFPSKIGDRVVVKTSNGESNATVTAVYEKSSSELALPIKQYKKIVRVVK